MGISKKLFGVSAIFGVPLIYLFSFLFEIIYPVSSGLLVVIFITILMVIWTFWMVMISIPYGAAQLKQVIIPDLEEELAEMLKKTTRQGELINLAIVQLFRDNKEHTRRELKVGLEKYGIITSPPTIDKYVKGLVDIGILETPDAEPYDKPYYLTKTGKYCLWIANTYFPATNLFFYWRYYVGIKGKRGKPSR
jgi:hypothetical protein